MNNRTLSKISIFSVACSSRETDILVYFVKKIECGWKFIKFKYASRVKLRVYSQRYVRMQKFSKQLYDYINLTWQMARYQRLV